MRVYSDDESEVVKEIKGSRNSNKWGEWSQSYKEYRRLVSQEFERLIYHPDGLENALSRYGKSSGQIDCDKNTIQFVKKVCIGHNDHEKICFDIKHEYDIDEEISHLSYEIIRSISFLMRVLCLFLKTVIGRKSGKIYYRNREFTYKYLVEISDITLAKNISLIDIVYFISRIDKDFYMKIEKSKQHLATIDDIYKKYLTAMSVTGKLHNQKYDLEQLRYLQQSLSDILINLKNSCKIFNNFYQAEHTKNTPKAQNVPCRHTTPYIIRGTDSLGNRLIYDSDLNITWYDYTNAPDTWQNQVAWATTLSVIFGGDTYTGWRLPRSRNKDGTGPCSGHNCTGSEMGHLYYTVLCNKCYFADDGTYPQSGWGLKNTGDFQKLRPSIYWSSTERAAKSACYFCFYNGRTNIGGYKTDLHYAIAVRDGDVNIRT